MAKNNIYLGTLSGKLGDNVWWRTHGQQRVRTYFKRTETNVGYEAALRRAKFANMKSIYQWLPETFKQACNMYKIGGNSYADFMQQYTGYSQTRDKYNFGAGHFMPVNCPVSFGTWNVNFKAEVTQGVALYEEGDETPSKGIVFTDMDIDDGVADIYQWTDYLLKYHPELHEGDYMHIMLGYVFYDTTEWGEPDAVEGLPFAYTGPYYTKLRLSFSDNRSIVEATNGMLAPFWHTGTLYQNWGFALAQNLLPAENVAQTSVVGSIMFERPTAARRQKYTPAQLVFDRTQLMILNSAARGRWRDYCAHTFTKNGE